MILKSETPGIRLAGGLSSKLTRLQIFLHCASVLLDPALNSLRISVVLDLIFVSLDAICVRFKISLDIDSTADRVQFIQVHLSR